MTPRAAAWCALFVLGAAVVTGCRQPDQLDMVRADNHITSALEASYHLPIADLTCPHSVDARSGATFRCSLQIDGHPLVVVVTQRSAKGDLAVQATAAVLVMAKVRADMVVTFGAELKRIITKVDCGHLQVQVVPPGQSLECTVSDGHLTKHVTVRVVDVNGSVSYAIH
jgi:hypothetical protein